MVYPAEIIMGSFHTPLNKAKGCVYEKLDNFCFIVVLESHQRSIVGKRKRDICTAEHPLCCEQLGNTAMCKQLVWLMKTKVSSGRLGILSRLEEIGN